LTEKKQKKAGKKQEADGHASDSAVELLLLGLMSRLTCLLGQLVTLL